MTNRKLNISLILFTVFILSNCIKPEETVEPVACFEVSKENAVINESISFTNCSQNSESYIWNFGDGTTSTDNDPTHTYSEAGSFTINLLAESDENYDQTTRSITITQTSRLPEVNTNSASSITETSAISGGNVTSDGGNVVTVKGVCWSTTQNPTTQDEHTSDGSGEGNFTSNITGLIINTTYYVRAYATNSYGTAYGENISFTTSSTTPIGDELFFSEYVEGTGNNKALEIFNPTNQAIDLADYVVKRYSNGSTTASEGYTTDLVGTIQAFDVFVLVNGQTESTETSPACDPDLQALADQLDGEYPAPTYFNGNDAITLEKKNGTLIDIFGKVGEDPGMGWCDDESLNYMAGDNSEIALTKDHTLIRKPTVKEGVIMNPAFFNPSIEWDTLPVDTYDNLGIHNYGHGAIKK
jgi:PKD repeat protein